MYPYVPKDQTQEESYWELRNRIYKAFSIGNNNTIPDTDKRKSEALRIAQDLQEEASKRRIESLLPAGAGIVLEEIKNTLQELVTPSFSKQSKK